MKILITGSSGHLGEGLMRTLRGSAHEVAGVDIKESPFTTNVGTIADRDFVRRCIRGVEAVIHTATLHKPHIGTHSKQEFIDTNVTGTLNLMEEAVAAGVKKFIFTSTTSAFGKALQPPPGAPAAWITEDVRPVSKNIYGATKLAAEDLCQLFHLEHKLPCLILRTSRFFPEQDDNPEVRGTYEDANVKANEFLHRRADTQDIVDAHLLALERAESIGFAKYIISASTPFQQSDLAELRTNCPNVVERYVPEYVETYKKLGWKMFPNIGRVYVNELARKELGWQPKYDFRRIVQCLKNGEPPRSALAQAIGAKGYHGEKFEGMYPAVKERAMSNEQ